MNNNSNKTFFLRNATSLRLEVPIKERIRTLLLRVGRSQNWLAGQVGVSSGTMSKIVNGDWFPSAYVMLKMGQVLECDSVVLFGDSKHWRKFHEKMVYDVKGNGHPKLSCHKQNSNISEKKERKNIKKNGFR